MHFYVKVQKFFGPEFVRLDGDRMRKFCRDAGFHEPVFRKLEDRNVTFLYDEPYCQVASIENQLGTYYYPLFMLKNDYKSLDAWKERADVINRMGAWLIDQVYPGGMCKEIERIQKKLKFLEDEIKELKKDLSKQQ
jgi:hypothetical protein